MSKALSPEARTQIRLMAEQMAEDRIALGELRADNARLREALAFYADEQNYRLNAPLDPNSSWFEGNGRARAALTPTKQD